MKMLDSSYKNNNKAIKWRSDDCAKNTMEKSRFFEIVTDTYNLLHGHVSAVLTNLFLSLLLFFYCIDLISFAKKKIK